MIDVRIPWFGNAVMNERPVPVICRMIHTWPEVPFLRGAFRKEAQR